MSLKEMRQMRICGEQDTFKREGVKNDHMLHYEHVFGTVFEKRESKCCAVLIKQS